MASLTVKLNTPANLRWSGAFPVEVRDSSKLVLAARGVSDGKLDVPAGRYFVTAMLPNGQQASVNDVVVNVGDDRQVQLSVADLDLPSTLPGSSTVEETDSDFVSPLALPSSDQRISILRGNWLANKIETNAPPPTREPTARARIGITYPTEQTWVEIAISKRCSYLAVPVDELRSTTLQWEMNPESGRLDLKYDFNDGEANSFFDFIRNDQTQEARSIGQSIIAQAETFMANKKRSPLCAVLGAYVLLRANELEGMDLWTTNMISWCSWLPDALAVRVEFLAREGRHPEAFSLLLQAPKWGTPWFRSGVAYLEKRAKTYTNVASGKLSNFPMGDADIAKCRRIAEVFGQLASMLDMTQSTTVLRADEPFI